MFAMMTGALAWGLAAPAGDVPEPPVERLPADYLLRWTAPSSCPSAQDIRARVLASRDVALAGEGVAELDGVVTFEGDAGYVLDLTTRFDGIEHTRRMRGAACAELAEATAIVIVVALRSGVATAMATDTAAPADPREATSMPSTRVDAPPREHGGAIAAAREGAAAGESAVVVSEPARRRRPPAPVLRAAGVGEYGVLGAVTGGVRLGVGLRWRQARVEVNGLYLAPRVRHDAAIDAVATFQAGIIDLRGCWIAVLPVALELPLCLGLEGGTVRVDAPFARTKRHTPWFAPLVAASLGRAFGPRVRLFLAVELAVRVAGMRYRVDGVAAFGQAPVSARGSLGLEIGLQRHHGGGRGAPR